MSATRKTIDPHEQFPLVEKILYELAWNFASQQGLQFEDVRSEAYEGFMRACNNFRAGKGMKFSSWVYFVVWGHLKSRLMKRAKQSKQVTFVELDEQTAGYWQEADPAFLGLAEEISRHHSVKQSLLSLFWEAPRELLDVSTSVSQDAQQLLTLLMESPAEIIDVGDSKAGQLAQAREYLVRTLGKRRALAAEQELRNQLAAAFAS